MGLPACPYQKALHPSLTPFFGNTEIRKIRLQRHYACACMAMCVCVCARNVILKKKIMHLFGMCICDVAYKLGTITLDMGKVMESIVAHQTWMSSNIRCQLKRVGLLHIGPTCTWIES